MKRYLSFLIMIFFFRTYGQKMEKFYNYRWQACEPIMARFYSQVLKTDSGYVRDDYFIKENSLQMAGKYDDTDCKVENGRFFYFTRINRLNRQEPIFMERKMDYGSVIIIMG